MDHLMRDLDDYSTAYAKAAQTPGTAIQQIEAEVAAGPQVMMPNDEADLMESAG